MTRFKKVSSFFLLSALLVGCSAPQNSTQPATGSLTVQGFEVQGKPNINRRKIALPAMTSMRLPGGLQAQETGPSPLPAWTGPRIYQLGYEGVAGPDFALNSSGDVFLDTEGTQYDKRVLKKFSSAGQLVGKQESQDDQDDHTFYIDSFLVVTEDSLEKETYHFVQESDNWYIQVYGTDLAKLNPSIPLDAQFPAMSDLWNLAHYRGFPQKEGVTISEFVHDYYDGVASRVTVMDVAAEPWREVGLREKVSLLFPRAYASQDFAPNAATAVAPDGSTYVAMYANIFDYNSCPEQCPGIAGITKIVKGEVEWQVYWDEPHALKLEDIAANDQGVHVLFNRSIDPLYPRLESTILSIDANGQVKGNQDIPLDDLRATLTQVDPMDRYEALPPLKHLKVDNAGRLALYNSNAVVTGQVGQNLSHLYVQNIGKRQGLITDVEFKGDYLYALGTTGNLFNNAGWPADPDATLDGYREAYFLLPMDFQLRMR